MDRCAAGFRRPRTAGGTAAAPGVARNAASGVRPAGSRDRASRAGCRPASSLAVPASRCASLSQKRGTDKIEHGSANLILDDVDPYRVPVPVDRPEATRLDHKTRRDRWVHRSELAVADSALDVACE